ncbi:hypothetical protein WDH52_22930 [Streptomyces sp. TRM70308]|uniref:hypothetical protein n=1 Tax=Streptomyces sp. TRM70308 TaxID=3131932 RepID=UPI003CFC3117
MRVTYHGWCVQESDEALVPVPFPDGSTAGTFLTPYERRFDLYSAGHTHTAAVTVEHWSSEPGPDERQVWDERAECVFDSASGQVAVWSDGRDEEFALQGPGRWQVRAHCAGRAEVERVCREEGSAYGVERYLLQFWPVS